MRWKEIAESVSIGGLEYEQKVWSALKTAEKSLPKLVVMGEKPSGGFDSTSPDIVLSYDNQELYIEVKKDNKAQTGGTSATYNMVTGEINLTKDIKDEDVKNLTIEILQTQKEALDKFINFIKEQEPTSYHNTNIGFPMRVTKDAWETAQKNGLLQPLNAKIVKDTSFVAIHYARKGINYIQIGGLGLFFLRKNPLNLPVPKLDGVVDIEIRPGRSGSKYITHNNERVKASSAGIRLQGRLKFNNTSPYTLDDPESIIKLFSE